MGTVSWKLCIFCQKKIIGENAKEVISKNVEKEIKNLANHDYKLKCRIGVK